MAASCQPAGGPGATRAAQPGRPAASAAGAAPTRDVTELRPGTSLSAEKSPGEKFSALSPRAWTQTQALFASVTSASEQSARASEPPSPSRALDSPGPWLRAAAAASELVTVALAHCDASSPALAPADPQNLRVKREIDCSRLGSKCPFKPEFASKEVKLHCHHLKSSLVSCYIAPTGDI